MSSSPGPGLEVLAASSDPRSVPPPDTARSPYCGLTAADRWVLRVSGGLTVVLVLIHLAVMARWGVPVVEVTSLQPRSVHYSLEINSATWVEWLQLPSVGETLARRIVEDREQRGPFRSVEDLGRVRGVGPKTLERIGPYLRLDHETAESNTSGP